jgi:hypothetical protein
MAARVKKPKKPKVLKVTKKQLGNLDKAESRKLAVFGMGLGLKQSFEMSPAEVITWIAENQASLLEADIPSCDQDKLFRPGVVDYLVEVQQYLRGEGENPKWNEDATPDAPTDEEIEPADGVETSPLSDVDDDDDEPAEVVVFPDTGDDEEPEPAPEEKPKMTKPAMRAGTTAPPTTFLRRTKAPAPEPEPEATPEPEPEPEVEVEETVASPTPTPVQTGLSAEEAHALIEMVGQTAEQVAEMPAALTALQAHLDGRVDDLKSRVDMQAVNKKVDNLTTQVRELAATAMYQSNAIALLVNFWRPMGEAYTHLSDVPDPATYADDVETAEE